MTIHKWTRPVRKLLLRPLNNHLFLNEGECELSNGACLTPVQRREIFDKYFNKGIKQVLKECPYAIEVWYTDNGTEYKGNPQTHAFAKLCLENKIEQRFTRVKTPKTNGKAERVKRTVNNASNSYKLLNHPGFTNKKPKRFINFANLSLKITAPWKTFLNKI